MVALLEVRELVLHYASERGPVKAVDSVSFEVRGEGEALGIIGETGSGKSSLVRALMRIPPGNIDTYSGEVILKGKEIIHIPEEEFRREIRWKQIAVVFQGAMNGFNPVIRMGDQILERMVEERAIIPEKRREVAVELLKKVGLSEDTFFRYPHELSGGMKQRAAIAMALSLNPSLLILDEPTSALDVSIQAQIMNVLKQLKWDMGLSMLFITHDIALASDLCDRIVVMYSGQLREYGSAEQVLLDPQDPYTRELLSSIPRLHGKASPHFVTGAPPDPAEPPQGCRFHPRCPEKYEICTRKDPPLFATDDGHYARCWLKGKPPEKG
ncbi:MAG: ABC transporter ATP-binding protein [Spirochaetes bacterium]|nr:MAG: ABC transporter ATP-binding protein [Spirochaetota bacterium]